MPNYGDEDVKIDICACAITCIEDGTGHGDVGKDACAHPDGFMVSTTTSHLATGLEPFPGKFHS